MRKAVLIIILFIAGLIPVLGQGLNHNFLIGDDDFPFPPYTFYDKGIIKIDLINFSIFGLSRKMRIADTQANISNDTGAILFYTNGCWIANALEDTMQNGSGLSPDPVTNQWCNSSGVPIPQANIVLPFPNDSNKYVLFHHGGSVADPNSYPLVCYYSIIDMSLNNGLGSVIQKNQVIIQDNLNRGLTACRHANGRDWWVVIMKHSSDLIYKILLTDQGISSITTQSLGIMHERHEGQKVFSPDGKKFAYRYYDGSFGNFNNQVRVFDFDRCSGQFSNPRVILWNSPLPGLGIAFSSNSKYLYTVSDFDTIYQINADTSNIQASMTVVAVNDGYYSPYPPLQSDFLTMYLAANGKITVSSGSSVVDLHYINYPDSAGFSCDVQQHALHMPCFILGTFVNHPNYYLGCDTTQTNCPCLITDLPNPSSGGAYDFRFNISPNPSSGAFVIKYLLPQNQPGMFSVYDINGRKVYEQRLPQWSTKQEVDMSGNSPRSPVTLKGSSARLQSGVYICTIRSGEYFATRKLVVIE